MDGENLLTCALNWQNYETACSCSGWTQAFLATEKEREPVPGNKAWHPPAKPPSRVTSPALGGLQIP